MGREHLFYVQDSRQYVGNDVLWWRKNNAGYTTNLDEAEIYNIEELKSFHRETDIAWPFDYINSLSRRAVDMQYLDHSMKVDK